MMDIDKRMKRQPTYTHAKQLKIFEVDYFLVNYSKATRWSMYGKAELEELSPTLHNVEIGNNLRFDIDGAEQERIAYFKEMKRLLDDKAAIWYNSRILATILVRFVANLVCVQLVQLLCRV